MYITSRISENFITFDRAVAKRFIFNYSITITLFNAYLIGKKKKLK